MEAKRFCWWIAGVVVSLALSGQPGFSSKVGTEHQIFLPKNIPVANPVLVWQGMSILDAPSARFGPDSVWTGTEMIVWGGATPFTSLNSGVRFDPHSDSWTALPAAGALPGLYGPAAVWSGSEMLVWGGNDSGWVVGDNLPIQGGRYDPSEDHWIPITATGALAGRVSAAAVWSGDEMIVWGGHNGYELFNDGMRYNPQTKSWSPISTTG